MELVLTIIIWAAIMQGFLLSMVFLTSKGRRSKANSILGWFLLAFVFNGISDLLHLERIGSYSLSGGFTLPEVKLFLPLLFLHYVLLKVGRSQAYHLLLKMLYTIAYAIISLTLVNILLFLIKGQSMTEMLEW